MITAGISMLEGVYSIKSFHSFALRVIISLYALGVLSTSFGCAANYTEITHTSTPDREYMHILVYSDAGYANDGQYIVSAAMYKRHSEYPFDFALCAGDNIQLKPKVFGSRSMINLFGDGGLEEAFALPFAPLIKSGLRFYTVAGNHDHQGFRHYIEKSYSDSTNAVSMNTGGFVFPSSDYIVKSDRCGGIKVIFLDIATAFSKLNWSNDRESFLRKELAGNECKWTILVFHYPLWSSGEGHGRDSTLVELRKKILPILDEYPVDFVFSGHDHHAELFKYRGKTVTRLAIVGNTAKPHDLNNEPDLPPVFRSRTRGYSELDIRENSAKLCFRATNGTVLFKDIIKK